MLSRLLHRIARRCPTHDRASYAKTRRLEQSVGIQPSPPPASFTDTYSDPEIIDCGNTWCTHQRR